MRLGRLTAELAQRGDGIVVEPLKPWRAPRSGSVAMPPGWWRTTTSAASAASCACSSTSTNIAPTLEALGYDPVVEGEKASVTLDLFWPGGPSDDFLNAAGGRVVVNLDKGQFLPVEPGGGRFVGLLSIAALPAPPRPRFLRRDGQGPGLRPGEGRIPPRQGQCLHLQPGPGGPGDGRRHPGARLDPGPQLRPAGRRPAPRLRRAGRGRLRGRARHWQHGAADLTDLPQAAEFAGRELLPGLRAAGTSRS